MAAKLKKLRKPGRGTKALLGVVQEVLAPKKHIYSYSPAIRSKLLCTLKLKEASSKSTGTLTTKRIENISFALRVQSRGWVGFGICPGLTFLSDVILGWVTDDGQIVFHVRYSSLS